MATMAVGTTKIWVQIVMPGENRWPTLVEVSEDAIIHHVVVEALKAELLEGTVSAGMVAVKFEGAEVQHWAQVSKYTNITDSNPLLLQVEVEGQPKRRRYGYPSLGSYSPSEAVKISSLHKLIQPLPLYSHWFALKVYDVSVSAKKLVQPTQHVPDVIRLTLDGSTYEIKKSALENVVKAIKVATQLCSDDRDIPGYGMMSDHALRSQELAFTCLFSRALDRFLFDDSSIGACLHQRPCRKHMNKPGNPEASDIYIVPLKDFKPGDPLLMSDAKLGMDGMDGFSHANSESSFYSVCGTHLCSGTQQWPVLLAFPTTNSLAEIQVHVLANEVVWVIPVVRGQPCDPALLCALYAAVSHLCQFPIVGNEPISYPMPLKDWDYQPYCPHGVEQQCRTFISKTSPKTFCKLFVKDDDLEPNLELLQAVGEFQTLDQISLTSDNHCVMLKYQYIDGSHSPSKFSQFAGVTRMLHKVHAYGFVHGDVRLSNIIFSGDTSYLIDYDLARKEGRLYPTGYNRIPERHEDAKPHLRMRKVHDRFSLAWIMTNHVGYCVDRTQANAIIERMKDCRNPLDGIADELVAL